MTSQTVQQHQAQLQQQSLSLRARLLAAAGASVASALVVNPLDVVKTRMQAQAAAAAGQRLAAPHLLEKIAVAGCSPSCHPATGAACYTADCFAYGSTLDGMRKIVRREGTMMLWRGTDVALLMAVPMVGIYLPLYDYLQLRLASTGMYAPLLAGAVARTAAVLCTSPLELVRTRMQAVLHGGSGSANHGGPASTSSGGAAGAAGSGGRPQSMWHHMQLNRGNGLAVNIRSMYTGVGATLARDVPFSAIYWGLLEPIRSSLTPTDGRHIPHSETLGINFLAGCIGGAAAAAITTPLDVVKTRVQLTENQHRRMPILRTMQEIAQGGGGPRGLFVGAGPRAARAAPACAIVLACYEGIKAVCIDGC